MHRIRYLALLAFIWTQHLFRLAYWKEYFEDVLNRHPPTPESTNLQLAPGRRTSSKDRWHLHVLLILRTCSNKAYSLLFRQTSLAKHFYVLTRARDSVCFSLHWASQILIRKQKAMKRADYNAQHLLNWHMSLAVAIFSNVYSFEINLPVYKRWDWLISLVLWLPGWVGTLWHSCLLRLLCKCSNYPRVQVLLDMLGEGLMYCS